MPWGLESPQWTAGGNINIAVFCIASRTADFTALQAVGSEVPLIGVSQQGAGTPPGVLGSTQYAATAGKLVTIQQMGEVTRLTMGANITRGDLLTSDINGNGVDITAVGNYCGAMALKSALINDLSRVLVMPPCCQGGKNDSSSLFP
jgi:hypothetical protein